MLERSWEVRLGTGPLSYQLTAGINCQPCVCSLLEPSLALVESFVQQILIEHLLCAKHLITIGLFVIKGGS